eukprot:7192618-Alexandrium_andersonii.AAC.1
MEVGVHRTRNSAFWQFGALGTPGKKAVLRSGAGDISGTCLVSNLQGARKAKPLKASSPPPP